MDRKKSLEEIEYEIKFNELKKIESELKKKSFLTPTFVTILIALISLFGSFIATYIQKENQLELDKQKFESELIITAVKTNDLKSSRDNLKFLIDVGLIKKNSIELSKVLNDSNMPILKLAPYTKINPIYSLEGLVVLPSKLDSKRIIISIWPHSTGNKTIQLKQNIPLNEDGKFKVIDLEEINYVIEIKHDTSILKRFLHSPNQKEPSEFKIFDLSKIIYP